MARRTKDEAEKTRDALLDAAEELFFERGVTRTSLGQIAQAAGVTRGALYWHFKDKSDLFHAMVHRVFLPDEDMLAELAACGSRTPLDDLQKSVLHALTLLHTDPRRRRVVTIMMLRCEYIEEMTAIFDRRTACRANRLVLIEQIFARARALGQLAAVWTPRRAAEAFNALISGLVFESLASQDISDLGKTAPACIKAFLKSMRQED